MTAFMNVHGGSSADNAIRRTEFPRSLMTQCDAVTCFLERVFRL